MALRPATPQDPAEKAALIQRAQEDVFRREVDEAVRQDSLSVFFRRFGKPLLVLAVLAMAAFGGWAWWHHKTTTEAEAAAVELTLAIDDLQSGKVDEAAAKSGPLAADDKPGAIRVSAQFIAALAALQSGDEAAAAKLFDTVADNAENPAPLRDLARIRSVGLRYDTMKPQEVIDRLKPLAVPGEPFFASAGELVAMAYVEQGKPELGGPMFAEIARDENAPDTLRARARQIAGLLGTDAVDDAEKLVALIGRGGAAGQ